MAGERCTMPNCYNEQSYISLGVCRLCYHRIYWASKNYKKTLEEAKAALSDMDSVAIKHGLVTEEDGPYSRRKGITSQQTVEAKTQDYYPCTICGNGVPSIEIICEACVNVIHSV